MGNQVGDGESWKQLGVLGLGQQTIKSVAPGGAATDFRIEMNVKRAERSAPRKTMKKPFQRHLAWSLAAPRCCWPVARISSP